MKFLVILPFFYAIANPPESNVDLRGQQKHIELIVHQESLAVFQENDAYIAEYIDKKKQSTKSKLTTEDKLYWEKLVGELFFNVSYNLGANPTKCQNEFSVTLYGEKISTCSAAKDKSGAIKSTFNALKAKL